MIGSDPQERAYLGPFLVFLGFLLAGRMVETIGDGYSHWALVESRYWLYPLQTVVCALLLWRWWRHYTFRRGIL